MPISVQHTTGNFERLIARMRDYVFLLADIGTVIAINPSAEKNFSVSQENILGCTLDTLFSNIQHTFIGNVTAADILSGKCQTFASQGQQQVNWVTEPLTDQQNKKTGLMLIGHCQPQPAEDIENVLNSLPGHAYWQDCDFVFKGCNLNQAQTIGLSSPKEIVGKTVADYQTKEHSDAILETNQEVLKHGKKIVAEEEGKRRDGSIGIYLSQKCPLRDKEGKIIGLVGTSFDITEIKEKQNLIFEQKETAEVTLQSLVALMPGHVYWQNLDGKMLGCNELQAQSLGLNNSAEIINKTVFDLLPEEQASAIYNTNKEVMRTGNHLTVEEASTYSDGTEKLFLSQKAPLRNREQEIIGCIGVSFDITDRKQAETELGLAKEKAELANQAKTEFIANISHDLRTPLHTALGLAEVLQMKVNNAEQEGLVDDLLQSGKTLLSLVEDILSYANLESGSLQQQPEEFNLYLLLKEMVSNIKPSADKKNINLILQYPDCTPRYIINDKKCIQRIVLNLLSNAIKFTNSGYIILSAECISHDETEAKLQLNVEDTGIGIDHDKLPHVFDRFYRIEPSYKGHYKGTGLGLAIARKLADSLNAELGANSTPGSGSTFWLNLPTKLQHTTTEKTKDDKANRAPTKNTPPKILLVEDEYLVQRCSISMLEELGCTVDVANTGEKALQLFANDYDLIFMDIGLPDISGLEVTKKIKKLDKNYPPIIALTAHVSDADKANYFKLGMKDFIRKPASLDDLKNALRYI